MVMRRNSGKREKAKRNAARSKHSRQRFVEMLESRQLLTSNFGTEETPHDHIGLEYLPPQQSLLNYGGYLSAPTTASPFDSAMDFLTSHANDLALTIDDLDDYVVTDQYQSENSGLTHIYLQQTHRDLEVVNSLINVNVAKNGSVLTANSNFIAGLPSSSSSTIDNTPILTAADALLTLGADFSWSFGSMPTMISADNSPRRNSVLTSGGVSPNDVTARLVYVPTPSGLELAWQLNIAMLATDHWYDASVSALDGDVLNVFDWVNHASYNVVALPGENPDDMPRTVEVNPHDLTASPFGWHDTDGTPGSETTDTSGNNVAAGSDRSGTSTEAGQIRPLGGGSLTFDFPFDTTQAASQWQDAAATNLFYWNNIVHDIHYHYGFNEAAG
ncbi:MAG: M36 family metallopeptidase, partial [Planctomycetales bacterium]|nr:M36 family metallopeptidase [Planctomycetales bacterium]